MHMVVQGGRGARHGVRDVEDDDVAMGSQHRTAAAGSKVTHAGSVAYRMQMRIVRGVQRWSEQLMKKEM